MHRILMCKLSFKYKIFRPAVRAYTIDIERSFKEQSSPLTSLPQPQRTAMDSIFDSDTIVVYDHPERKTGAFGNNLKH